MPIKYVPFIPEPVEGQAVLGNFNRILRYKGADDVSMTLQRGMPLYEMEKQETVGENADGNMVIRGECVSACAYLKEQGIQVDLVYIDPPFASGADYAKKVYIRRNPKVAEAIDENGRLTEEAVVCPFVLNAEITMKEYITSIKNMYQEISDMNVSGRSVTANTFFAGFTSPVDIDKGEKEFITAVAEQLKCELSDSFFELGNLNKDTLTSNPLSGLKLNGTSEEKQKYWKIKRLHETISKALEWAPIEKAFSGMNCIKLAIQNCGKAIDEDAEITFEVPKESLLTLGEFPKFNNAEMGYLLTDCDMSILFGIEGTSEYIEYSESEQNGRTPYGARPYGLPGYVPDYSDDFTDEIKDVFCYGFYSSEDKYIVKLKVDYIKHNTTVAFPTILFVKNEIDEIPYKITSKNNPDVVEGCIKVKS